jgi:uncharacterized protein (UPF0332 family)
MSLQELIKYRVERAKESLEEAQLMANHQHWNTAINRLYYSAFYMVDALLIQRQIPHKSHAGTRKQFHHHFSKTGTLPKEAFEHYNNVFQDRQESDYGELVRYTEEDFKMLFPPAKEFLELLSLELDSYAS